MGALIVFRVLGELGLEKGGEVFEVCCRRCGGYSEVLREVWVSISGREEKVRGKVAGEKELKF